MPVRNRTVPRSSAAPAGGRPRRRSPIGAISRCVEAARRVGREDDRGRTKAEGEGPAAVSRREGRTGRPAALPPAPEPEPGTRRGEVRRRAVAGLPGAARPTLRSSGRPAAPRDPGAAPSVSGKEAFPPPSGSRHLAAGLLVCLIALGAGCEGASVSSPPLPVPNPPTAPPAAPDPPSTTAPSVSARFVFAQYYRNPEDGSARIDPPGPYAYSGDGDPVRIGVDDTAVDFLHPDLRGRIFLDDDRGASFASYLPGVPAYDLQGTAFDNGAFAACTPGARCHVFFVASGSRARNLTGFSRTIAQRGGCPPGEGRCFMYDTSNGSWYLLPGGAPREMGVAEHGTWVARVAAREAPEAVIAPWAFDFSLSDTNPYLNVGLGLGGSRSALAIARYAESYDLNQAGAEALARHIDAWHRSADVINSSYRLSAVNVNTNNADVGCGRIHELLGVIAQQLVGDVPRSPCEGGDDPPSPIPAPEPDQTLRSLWDAYTQSGRPAADRTIRVWAAGNERETLGEHGGRALQGGWRTFPALEPYFFEALRGHTIAVTALDSEEQVLAPYANPCGPVPPDWDAARHGRHFCLAAPGDADLPDVPDGPEGTSFAAPYVAGVLARMMAASRRQVGNTELVKRLMDTADNEGEYAKVFYYGAGKVNPETALGVVGGLTTGTPSNPAALDASTLRLPAAWGDAARSVADVEVASFDDWNFPFWTPADRLVRPAAVTLNPIPALAPGEGRADGSPCPDWLGLAPGAACLPGGAGLRWAGAASADGAGASYRLSDSVTLAAFVREAGRLDAAAAGAFSFAGGSSLGLLRVARGRILDEGGRGRWRLDGEAVFALDTPHGIGTREGSMFEAGPALLSSWTLGLERRGGRRGGAAGAPPARTRLAISQPPRAETGTGRLTWPAGRTLDGTRLYRTRAFPLTPSRRELSLALSHRRPLFGGEAAVSVSRTENPGHRPGPAVHGFGLAWGRGF